MKQFWTIRRHAFAWVTLSGIAAVYLWSLFQLPETVIASSDATPAVTEPAATSTNRAMRVLRPTSSGGELGKKEPAGGTEIAALRSEIVTVRQLVEDLIRQEARLAERLDIIESAFGPSTSALPPSAGQPRISGGSGAKRKLAAPAPKVSVTYSSLPSDGFGDILITGSPLPVSGPQETTQTRFGVELATAVSTDTLKKEWIALAGRHEELLGKLQVRRQTSGTGSARGPKEVKLIAGPFSNAASAALLCARLQAEGAFCKETIFAGEAF